MPDLNLIIHPVTPERWPDIEALFGVRGACGGCWCMVWRESRADFQQLKGHANRQLMQALVKSDAQPGLLAYQNGQPVGWVALAPRSDYPALGRSRILKPVDDQPVWSLTCFFVAKEYRNQGVTLALLEAAKAHAQDHGAQILEGYPVAPRFGRYPTVFAFTGLLSVFEKAEFCEVARRSPTRPIMRYYLTKGS